MHGLLERIIFSILYKVTTDKLNCNNTDSEPYDLLISAHP